MKLAVVIPAYNEAKTIGDVIKRVPRQINGFSQVQVFVVSDNSSDQTAVRAKEAGAKVLVHKLNLGAGGATQTGLYAAKRLGFDVVASLDGDGQHDPEDLRRLALAFQQGKGDLIIGSRFLSLTIDQMPLIKNFGNRLMNLITRFFSRTKVTDSQSGFRLFGPKVLARVSQLITTPGYEFCSETIINCRRLGLTIAEVPISTIYFADRRTGTDALHGFNILLRLTYKSLTR